MPFAPAVAPQQCACGDLCSNKSLHMRRMPRAEPFLTANNRGWGVRALEPISKVRPTARLGACLHESGVSDGAHASSAR
jgi:hypothetical protein